MKGKNLMRILIFLIISTVLSSITWASLDDIAIIKEEINPQVVEPGQGFSVAISVWNKGGEDKKITVELLEEFPFKIKSTDQNFVGTFDLCSGCKRSDNYYLTTDPRAVSGIYKLNFLVKEGDLGLKRIIDVEIKGKSDLIFKVLELSEEITPDSEFEVKLELTNGGTGIARNIKLDLNSEKFFLKGSNLVSLDELAVGVSRIVTLNILAGNSIEKGVYAIPVNLEYEDYNGNLVTSAQDLSVRVLDKAELNIKEIKIKPDIIKPGEEVSIQVRIENVGEGNAENIKLVLESEIEGNKIAYLGRLEKDDDSPVFFSGKVVSSGEKTDILTISYQDDLGQHSLTEEIRYSVRGISTASFVIIGLIIVILILAGLLVLSWVYKSCKCMLKGKKCPQFNKHVNETIGTVTEAFKRKKRNR